MSLSRVPGPHLDALDDHDNGRRGRLCVGDLPRHGRLGAKSEIKGRLALDAAR